MSCEEFAFEEIHQAFRLKIQRYLIQMVGEYEAEDLTQEVFIRISQGLEYFKGESSLSTWIYRIATNTALDRLRSPSLQQVDQKCSPEPFFTNAEHEIDDRNTWTGEKIPMIEQQVYRKEMNACILDFIKRLPEGYRTVLVLRELEGLSNHEIAEILGVSLGTVKIRLHRSRERLKNEMEAKCDSYWVEGNEFIPELRNARK